MRSSRMAVGSVVAASALTLGVVFALPASALPGDDNNCPEHPGKTCTQTPPERCPAGTTPAGVQPPAGEGVTCSLDSLVRARAKADVLTHDELLKLCADVKVRGLANVRVAVGHPYEVITLDGRTCGLPKPPKPCGCPTPPEVGPPAPSPAPAPNVPVAPAPVTVIGHLPVTH